MAMKTRQALSLTEPTEKLYFVKRRTMRDEPERQPKLRKIKKVERKPKLPPLIKKKVQRLKYTQRGLTEVGEKRKEAREAREAPFSTPSVAELLQLEKLQKRAVPPAERERERLLKELESEIPKKAKEAGVSPDDKRKNLMLQRFRDAGFDAIPEPVLQRYEELPEDVRDIFAANLTQKTTEELRDAFPEQREEEAEAEPPAYTETERAIAELLPEDAVSKKGIKLLREAGLRGKQYRTSIKELDKLSSADIRYLMTQYEQRTESPDYRFIERLDRLRASKEARGMGLKFKKGKKQAPKQPLPPKRGRGRPKGSKNKPKAEQGAGLLSDIKALAKHALKKVKENPVETAVKAFELAKKGHALYKGRKEKQEEAKQERVREHIKKTWDGYDKERAGSLPLSKSIKRVGKAQSRLL